jgi:hypothetical protein
LNPGTSRRCWFCRANNTCDPVDDGGDCRGAMQPDGVCCDQVCLEGQETCPTTTTTAAPTTTTTVAPTTTTLAPTTTTPAIVNLACGQPCPPTDCGAFGLTCTEGRCLCSSSNEYCCPELAGCQDAGGDFPRFCPNTGCWAQAKQICNCSTFSGICDCEDEGADCDTSGNPCQCSAFASTATEINCEPLTCDDLGCGLHEDDDCGNPLDCGECCTPRDFCNEGDCGLVVDGCGGTIDCGECPCVPLTCSDLGIACGPGADNCGNAIDCGACQEEPAPTPPPAETCIVEGERCVSDVQCCAGLCRGRGCQDRGTKICQVACSA